MRKAFQIRGAVKNYEWGKIGLQSAVAQFMKSAFSDFLIDDIPYAELWMGTHDSGPAQIPSLENMKVIDWIQEHPECLGKNITDSYDSSNGLPFLFKVLSVNKALSIQVHPDKKSAEKLREEFPEHYPDSNHKPEIAIALTDFEALCGFRPLQEIKEFLSSIPQLKKLIGEDLFEKFLKSQSLSNLKSLFTVLMACSKDTYQSQLAQVVKTFEEGSLKSNLCKSIQDLFIKTATQYPGDIGCFCLFFLNYLKLKPGEAIFLAANEPHAYLSGDCIESMACSDNVVRAGLTPKFKDVKTLCDMLTYNCRTGEENIFPYVKSQQDPYLQMYTPPIKEFAVDVISLPTSCGTYSIRSINSASILIVTQGIGSYKSDDEENDLTPGSTIFISSEFVIHINPKLEMLMFRSYCNA